MTGPRRSSRGPIRKEARSGKQKNRTSRARHGYLGWKSQLILLTIAVILGLFAWAGIERHLAPTTNTLLNRFDAIIVLGVPADKDGNPTPLLLARVTEAVHEYERGVAPRLILSGGPDRYQRTEAGVMASVAEAQGIPASAIFEETQARDTIENACYSMRIMQSHDWHSAEVVSSASHLPRAGLIFSLLPLEWRTHAAPSLEPDTMQYSSRDAALETLKTVRYLVWVRQFESCKP